MRLVDSVLSLGALLVPICAILVGGAIAIAGMIHRHAERIAKIERGIDPDVSPRSLVSQPDVGRQCDNRIRIPVHESRLAPNIGLEELWSLHTLELVRPIPAHAG